MSNIVFKAIQATLGPKPLGPYSNAVQVNNIIYLSGIIGILKSNKLIEGGIKAETELIFQHMENILKECGSSFDRVIQVRIYLEDIKNSPVVNELYQQYFKSPFPARVMMEVSKLPLGAKIEIEASAVIGNQSRL